MLSVEGVLTRIKSSKFNHCKLCEGNVVNLESNKGGLCIKSRTLSRSLVSLLIASFLPQMQRNVSTEV